MKRLVCVLGCMLALVGAGHAAVIFDTISYSSTGGFASLIWDGPPSYYGLAASFSTGTTPFQLEQVDLLLGPAADTPTRNAVQVFLTDDFGLQPWNILADLGSVSDADVFANGPGVFQFLTNFALAPSTRYWIFALSMGDDPTTSSGWGLTLDLTPDSVGEYNWNLADGTIPNQLYGYAWQMRISGTDAVPEPSTLLLSVLGVGALALWRRRTVS